MYRPIQWHRATMVLMNHIRRQMNFSALYAKRVEERALRVISRGFRQVKSVREPERASKVVNNYPANCAAINQCLETK